MEEPESSTQELPKLKAEIRIAPFHEKGAACDRYLVEVGETCFVAGQGMHDVLKALREEPETIEELARTYERQTGSEISRDTLAEVIEKRIPKSLFSDTPDPRIKKPFSVSLDLVPESWIRPLSSRLTFLFDKSIVIVVACAFLVAEYLVLSQSLTVYRHSFHGWDTLYFLLTLIVVTLFHELGHASACRRYDCPHGNIGIGIYFVYPTFYTDVTKAWRLPPLKRAVIDIGGVYFQAILFVVLTTYVLLFGSIFVLRLLWVMNFTMLFTLNPIFKMDGYWLLSDLSGLSNLHRQMGAELTRVLKKLFRRPDVAASQVQGLRRKVLCAYSILAVAFYGFIFHFLYHSFFWVVQNFPMRAAFFFNQMKSAFFDGRDLSALYAFGQLVRESIWPLIFACALFFMARRITRLLIKGLRILNEIRYLEGVGKEQNWQDWLHAHIEGWKSKWVRQG